MDNSYFIYPNANVDVELPRFHSCIWEFDNNSSLVEFGFEISSASLNGHQSLDLILYIPWLTEKCILNDLYDKLKDSANSKFIFNTSVTGSSYLDGGDNMLGVVYQFIGRDPLCLLPIELKAANKKIKISINLAHYNNLPGNKPNIYVRFSIKPNIAYVSNRRKGIAKSQVIYDIKFNERRNLPDNLIAELANKGLCKIDQCFSFNILPDKYDIIFYDNASLQSVRTLEYDSFIKYIGDKRVKKDQLMVVFNKKKEKDSYSFFSMYSKERIGLAQFSLALLLNVSCGILFFISQLRIPPNNPNNFKEFLNKAPLELYLAIGIFILTAIFFLWPLFVRFKNWFLKLFQK